MLAVLIVTWIGQSLGIDAFVQLWAWFSSHILLTILLLIFLA